MTTQELKAKARERFEKSISKGFVRNTVEQKYFWDFLDSLIEDIASEIRRETLREYLVETLVHFHKNRLEGKGFDFFFVLSNDLDNLSARDTSPKA